MELAAKPAAPGEKFPPLDELVGRIPADLMGVLDDLFRAKFTGVRRFAAAEIAEPKGAALSPASPAPPAGGR